MPEFEASISANGGRLMEGSKYKKAPLTGGDGSRANDFAL